MTYRLICKGRLIEGTHEAKAVLRLKKLTGLSTDEVVEKLLSGKRVKLKSSDDKARMEDMCRSFREIGLDVELVEPEAEPEVMVVEASDEGPAEPDSDPDPAPPTPEPEIPEPPTASGRRVSPLIIALGVLLLLAAGMIGYAWYWLHAPLPEAALRAEQALADGRLVTIGHLNVEKGVRLQHYFLGELDPAALPIADKERDLLGELFDGPAALREHLRHLFFAVHADDKTPAAQTVILLSGDFEREAVLQAMAKGYRLEDRGEWSLLQPPAAKAAGFVCPDDADKKPAKQPLLIKVTPDWVMVASERAYGDGLMARLAQSATAAQDITAWRAFRQGRLASLMVFSPQESSAALTGLTGMLARKAAKDSNELTHIAAGVQVDMTVPGLMLNLLLGSADVAWRDQVVADVRQGIDKLKQDSGGLSPTLAGMFDRVSASTRDEAVAVDVALDGALLDDLGQVLQEGFASLFSVEVRDPNQPEGEQADQIDTRPRDYSAGAVLASLPPLKIESYQQEPLFRQGAFGVDLEGIKMNEDSGGLELNLQGLVMLPKREQSTNTPPEGELSLMVSAVVDATGNDLLRDERCVKNVFYSGGFNHQPSTMGTLFGDRGQIHKQLRLKPEAKVEDIARIEGWIKLSAPVSVRRFQVPLQVGESVEYAGLRFYLSSVKDSSIGYQLSGATERFLELRGLNAESKPLKKGWRMGDTEGGRATQQFKGKVRALEVYVTERLADHQARFVLRDLFRPGKEKDDNRPAWLLAPAGVDYAAWKPYEKLDMGALQVDPKKWYVSDRNKAPLADRHWPAVSLYITHTPKQWGNHPQAHVYFPMVPELPGVLSALGYRILDPAEAEGPGERYKRVHYPYYSNSGERVVDYKLGGLPLALNSWTLETGLEDNAILERLKGELVFRLPLATKSTHLDLKGLWSGATVDGVTVTLTDVGRGLFPGYGLKIEGDLAKLVNLHGLDAEGRRVMADPVNYQSGGYWTMTLPFGKGIEQVELILATEQKVLRYPFDLNPVYPE